MARPKKNPVRIESDTVVDTEQYKAQEVELIALQDEFNKLVEANKKLNQEFQLVLNENKELKTKMVKIALIEPNARFVRKIDIIKLLKSFQFNEPDLADFAIIISPSDINLTATTKSGVVVSLSLPEAQKFQI
jgi:hypothetical protein